MKPQHLQLCPVIHFHTIIITAQKTTLRFSHGGQLVSEAAIESLRLPMPKGRGFVRSLNLSLHLLAQASLFLRAWPVRPYCIAPKGHNITLLYSYTFSPRTRHSSPSPEIYISKCYAAARGKCSPILHLIVLLHFC